MIDTILTFLEAHWELILHIVLLLVSSVLFIIRKKPTQVVDGIVENLFKLCVTAVSVAEKTDYKGSHKLDFAISYVLTQLHNAYPQIDVQLYTKSINQIIEAILSTPQKHDER